MRCSPRQHATRLAPPPGDVVPVAGAPLATPWTERDAESPSVAYDDATTLTLAAHRATGAVPDLVVLVWCAPGTTVGALVRRGVGRAQALALWNAMVRTALRATAGLPVVVIDGDACAVGDRSALAPLYDVVPAARSVDVPASQEHPPPSACGADELGVGAPRPGLYPQWTVPALAPAPPWCDELLRAVSGAHRALLEARDAWEALDARRRAAPAEARAVVAVRERELRELHDRVRGLTAQVADLTTALDERERRRERDRAAAEDRSTELAHRAEEHELAARAAHDEIDRILASRQWKVGRVVLAPFRAVRRGPRP